MLDEKHDTLKLFISAILGTLSAITLNQWVLITTLLYGVMQIGLLIPRYIALFRGWRKRRAANDK